MRTVAAIYLAAHLLAPSVASAQCQYNADDGTIVTHYPSVGGTTVPLLTPSTPYTYGTAIGVLPYLNNYISETYAITAGPANVVAWDNTWCANTGHPIRNYNWSANIVNRLLAETPTPGWAPRYGTGRIRIINGVQIPGSDSFVTIILPPTFEVPTPWVQNHPVIATGYYDVNDNLYNGAGEAQRLLMAVAASVSGSRIGAIGVVWNGGASTSGITGSQLDLDHFDVIMKFLVDSAWADVTKLYMTGRSRGASTALAVAGNTGARTSGYKVRFVSAISPGVQWGSHADMISATMPMQYLAMGAATGFNTSWQPNWQYPAVYPPTYFMAGAGAYDVTKYNFFGSSNTGTVNAMSPLDDSHITKLAADDVRINLSFGSHDEFIPFGHEVEYAFKLRDKRSQTGGASHYTARIVLGGGHLHDNFYNSTVDMQYALLYEMDNPSSRVPMYNQIFLYQFDSTNGQFTYRTTLETGAVPFPFTVQAPKRVVSGLPFYIYVTGEPGTTYSFTVSGSVISGTVPASRHVEHYFSTTNWTPATYTFTSISATYPWGAAVGGLGTSPTLSCTNPYSALDIQVVAFSSSFTNSDVAWGMAASNGCAAGWNESGWGKFQR